MFCSPKTAVDTNTPPAILPPAPPFKVPKFAPVDLPEAFPAFKTPTACLSVGKKIGAKPWRIPLQNEAKLWIRERSVAIFSQASTEMLWEKEGLTM